jgi:UDP-glucose 4-epimerase
MDLTGKKIAVTGGAGFIGSHLVDLLIQKGAAVTVVDNFATGSMENLSSSAKGVRVIEGDVRDLPLLEKTFAGQDMVFHLATHCVRLSLSEPLINHEVNATGTMNALVAARKGGVERFIYCSSSEVYGNVAGSAERGIVSLNEESPKIPTTVYGASKLVGEHYTHAFFNTLGLKTIIVRPFNAYGPRAHFSGPYGEVIPRFIALLKTRRAPVIFGTGKQTRDFTFVKDIARAMLSAARTDSLLGDHVNIAKGEEVSILSVYDHLSALIEGSPAPVHHPARPGDIDRLAADVSKARGLGLEVPRTGLREGLREYLGWLDAQKVDFKPIAEAMLHKNW